MVEVSVVDEHFGNKTVKLSILQQIKLKLSGRVYLFHASKEGWRAELPLYLTKCNKHNIYFIDYPHGFFEDYPHGFDGHFHCPKCDEEHYQFIESLGMNLYGDSCSNCL